MVLDGVGELGCVGYASRGRVSELFKGLGEGNGCTFGALLGGLGVAAGIVEVLYGAIVVSLRLDGREEVSNIRIPRRPRR